MELGYRVGTRSGCLWAPPHLSLTWDQGLTWSRWRGERKRSDLLPQLCCGSLSLGLTPGVHRRHGESPQTCLASQAAHPPSGPHLVEDGQL